MKRYFLLTSVLALAACGGGSGGGGSGIVAPVGYNGSARVSDTAIASNSSITNMKSEVVVASNSSSPIVSRSATTHSGGVTYTSYRLDDIKLYAADASHTGDGYLQIGLDNNGRIDKMTMELSGAGAAVTREEESKVFHGPILEYVADEVHVVSVDDVAANADVATRNAYKDQQHWDDGKWVATDDGWNYIEYGDQAVTRIPATEGVSMANLTTPKDSNGDDIAGHWNFVNEYMTVETYGKDIGTDDQSNTISLQYSDFGHFNPVYKEKLVDLTSSNGQNKGNVAEGWNAEITKDARTAEQVETLMGKEDYQLFAGGYAITGTSMSDDRPTLTPTEGAEYKGMAIGRVYASIQGGGAGRDAKLEAWDVPYDLNIDDEDDSNDAYSNNAGHDMAKKFTTTEATMTIGANGKQTLEMPFHTDGFYDVKVVKEGSDPAVVTFTDTGSIMTTSQYRRNDNEGTPEVDFNPGYYGVNTASEAAGTMRYYSKEDLGGGFKREWEFQAAYGMVKQPDNN